ncbi:hypothetical protein DFH11DRAFT_1734778 [Phellopilus nigrolimitatus]|nr:hypothetical protein DFH11DRAFT_1734778 [Phellopilus nigrolimitatus]
MLKIERRVSLEEGPREARLLRTRAITLDMLAALTVSTETSTGSSGKSPWQARFFNADTGIAASPLTKEVEPHKIIVPTATTSRARLLNGAAKPFLNALDSGEQRHKDYGRLGTVAWQLLRGGISPCTRARSRSPPKASVQSLSYFTWLYVAVKPLVKPTSTPPYDVFALFLVLFVDAILMLGGMFFVHCVSGDALPSWLMVAAYALNLLLPSDRSPRRVRTSPKMTSTLVCRQKTTLWTGVNWIQSLITRGIRMTFNEDDSSLMWKIWAANSLDIIYSGSFFLKRIIDAIDTCSPAAHARVYLFAALIFGAQVLKSKADVQHLWFGRLTAVRIRSQLMRGIYDKALKCKDFSGVVNADAKDAKVDGEEGNKIKGGKKAEKKEKERKEKADDPKAGADVCKIVNLMAGNANRISGSSPGFISSTVPLSVNSFVYPFGFVSKLFAEFVIACTFLYQLLGCSIAKHAIRIQKGVLATRDKCMGVLNELIGVVKFMKFFAWED